MNALELNSYLNADCSVILADGVVLSGFIAFCSFDSNAPKYYFVPAKNKERYYGAHFNGNKELMRRYCAEIDIDAIKHMLKIPVRKFVARYYLDAFISYLTRLKASFSAFY